MKKKDDLWGDLYDALLKKDIMPLGRALAEIQEAKRLLVRLGPEGFAKATPKQRAIIKRGLEAARRYREGGN